MLLNYFSLISVLIAIKLCYGDISDKQYATMPPLFHQDNYDQCMLLDDDALYCSFTYKVRSKTNGENGMWKIIQEVSSDKYNYRHDHLRHWICVPSTCPEITFHGKNHSEVQKDVEHCYNTKYSRYGLRGSIENFKCDNRSSKYPMDWLDIVVAMIFTLNAVVVVFGTFYEGTARFKSEEEYQKSTSKGWRRIVSAFSIPRNWHRLITVNITPDNEKLRSMQGIRFYTSLIVILAHTVLSATMGPIANTKYVEMIPGTAVSVLLSNGCLIMSLFFFTSAFFVMYGLFSQFEKRELKLKDLVGAVISRYIRLTPCLLVMIAFSSTWFRHLGDGPIWSDFIDTQFIRCRKNWWTNLLYVNNFVDSTNMCLTHTWYMASDTQYFIIMLLIVWILKIDERLVWPILGSLFSIAVVATFLDNYVEDYEGLIVPLPEKLYMMKMVLHNNQWHHQSKSFQGNFIGSIVGLAFGYLFYKNRNKSPFDKNVMNQIIFHILVYGLGLGMAILPPVIIMNKETEHDIFWASLNVALGRTIFIIAIGSALFLTFFGVGWITKAILEWHPSYILARLSFSAYLVHTTIIYYRVASSRFPTYVSDFHLVYYWCGDVITSYILGLLMTLFVELPTSELQKMMIPTRSEKKE